MKEYLILSNDNIIENIIVCEGDDTAEAFGAVPSYDGARIGDVYNPPAEPDPKPAQKRETAYNTQAIISWDGSMLTVTEAAQLWQ